MKIGGKGDGGGEKISGGNFFMKNLELAWNSFGRICDLMDPLVKATRGTDRERSISKLRVPGRDLKYEVVIGYDLPSFIFVPTSMEVFQRLVMRAALVEDLNELDLTKSKCWSSLSLNTYVWSNCDKHLEQALEEWWSEIFGQFIYIHINLTIVLNWDIKDYWITTVFEENRFKKLILQRACIE